MTTATTLQVAAASASNKTYICSLFLKASAANNVALVEGTGGSCVTGITGVIGGTTTSNGLLTVMSSRDVTTSNALLVAMATGATETNVYFATNIWNTTQITNGRGLFGAAMRLSNNIALWWILWSNGVVRTGKIGP